MATVISATEASKNFSEVLHKAHYSGNVIIEKNGKPYAMLSPIRSPLTGAQILNRLRRASRPRMTKAEVESFADDVERVRNTVNKPPVLKW